MARIFKYLGIALAVLAGLLVLAVVVINLIPGEKYKALISSSVESATGRKLDIEGDIDISLFSSFAFKASGIKFANAEWGTKPHITSVGDIEAEIALFPLIKGILDVTLVVDAPDLHLETNSSGQGNWVFTKLVEEVADEVKEAAETVEKVEESLEEAQSESGLPLRLRIRKVLIEGTNIVFLDGKTGNKMVIDKEKLLIGPADGRLAIDLVGKFNDTPLALTGGLDNAEFFVDNQPAEVTLDGNFGDAKLAVRGTAGPLAPTIDLDVKVDLNTDSVAAFSPLAGRDLPDIGPLAVSVKLTGKEGKYAVSDLLTTLKDKTLTAEAKGSVADLIALTGLKLEANISTDQLTEILQSVGVRTDFSLPDAFKAALVAEGSLEELAVKQFQTTIQGQNLSIDGTAQIKNIMTLEGISAEFLLEAESLDYIAELAKTELPPFSPLKATINLTSSGKNLDHIDIKAGLDGNNIHADVAGSIGDPVNLKEVDAKVNLGLDSLAWIADYAKMKLPPLGTFKASANIASKADTFEVKDIQADLAGENITAKVTGTVADLLKVQGVDATVALGVQSLDFVEEYIDMELPPLGPLNASAGIASKGDTFEARDIQVKLAGDKIHANLAGSVGDLLKLKAVTADVDFGLESLVVLSEIAQTELPNLGPLNASASIASKDDIFEVTSFKAELSDEKIKARVAASVADIMKLAGINADINFSVDTLASLGPLVKQDLPTSGPVTLEGKLSNKDGLEGPTDIDTVVKSDGIMANLSGSIAKPLEATGIDLTLNLEADSMQHLGRLTGTEFSSQEPLTLEGRFTAAKNTYELAGLHLSIGELDIKGEVAFEGPSESRERPRLNAALHIGELDLSQQQKAKLEAASEEIENAQGEEEEVETDDEVKKEKLFPSHPLPWEPLRNMDAKIEFTVESLTTLQLNLEDVVAGLTLDKGLLNLKPLQARVGDGTFGGSATLDARTSPATLMADIKLADATFRDFGGKVNFLVDVVGGGDSVAEIMAGLDGQLAFDVKDVTLKQSLMTGFGTGLLSSLNPFTKEEEDTELICAIILFDIENGIADANKKIAAQMTDVTWFGSGEINLETEEIDFGMNPKPRKGLGISLGSLAKLAHVGGTLAHPKVELDPTDAAVKYGKYTAAMATGGLTLVADLLFSKIKANKDVCTAIMEDLEEIQEADELAEKEGAK